MTIGENGHPNWRKIENNLCLFDFRTSRKVEALCRDFEQQRICYLPLYIFLLRPLHRLLHYKLILERLCKHYPPTHDDFRDCRGTRVSSVVSRAPPVTFPNLKPPVPSAPSGPGRDLRDGAAAPGHHDEDGKLPEASRAEEGSDRYRKPRHPREGSSVCLYFLSHTKKISHSER